MYSNPIEAQNYLAVMVTLNGTIKKIQTLAQICPSLESGIEVMTFVTVDQGKKLILADEHGAIIYSSSEFNEQVIEDFSMTN